MDITFKNSKGESYLVNTGKKYKELQNNLKRVFGSKQKITMKGESIDVVKFDKLLNEYIKYPHIDVSPVKECLFCTFCNDETNIKCDICMNTLLNT